MQATHNQFIKGLNSDMHPLTTSQQEYTDALNATLITFNGNELMLQNDMGNTKILDAKTGNIMGLREGFIPVGLKEHGGIMYIASVNKEGKGEIGTIPSPVIRYNQLDSLEAKNYKYPSLNEIVSDKSDLFKLTDTKINTGEKFVVILDLKDDKSNISYRNCNGLKLQKEYNMFTKRTSGTKTLGVYKVGLYSQTDDLIFDLNKYTELEYDYYKQ